MVKPKKSRHNSSMGQTPEEKAREVIDQQLQLAGWVIQDKDEFDRNAALGVVVREFGLQNGHCDYLLFVAGKACGVIEAKPAGTTLSGVAEQTQGYQFALPPTVATWGTPLRFGYEATGVETRFVDRVDPVTPSRAVFSFHRPETLNEWLKAKSSLRLRLQGLPELNPDGLRLCQIEAIDGLEHALKQGQARAFVQMATGAGKTFTAASLSYRLLAHADARRILFLVDRNNLGRQTLKEFQSYRPPGTGRLFTDLYNVQRLAAAGMDGTAKVVISTIQRLYAQLSGETLSEEDEDASDESGTTIVPTREIHYAPALPPETFDIVIVDECHRSIYGNWRQLLDYFDAQILGLTATPTVQTMAFFGNNLVAEYPYERSVIDGVNVPFEVFRIRTRVGEEGGKVDAGIALPVRDKRTRKQRYETLEEDFDFPPEALDRSVLAPDQIRTVLTAYRDSLPTMLFPGRTHVPKTLIFAKDDHHAEEIVTIAREVFGRDNDFAKKITYRVSGVDPNQLIQQFRNSYNPRIAVTVDMIATGTDVKPIEVLIFMRDVKSQVYYEQMRGRGVRSIDPAQLKSVTPDAGDKELFYLIDAVGVSETEKAQTVPMERKRHISFEKLLEQVAAGASDEDTLSTLAVRLATLAPKLNEEQQGAVIKASDGLSVHDLASRLADALDNDRLIGIARGQHGSNPSDEQIAAVAQEEREAAIAAFSKPALRQTLIEAKRATEIVIADTVQDEIVSTGFDLKAAEAMTTSFRDFIDQHRDQLAALTILYARPASPAAQALTYQSLKELKEAMLKPPWLLKPETLWQAYRRLLPDQVKDNPARLLTDLIVLVRFAIGAGAELAPFAVQVTQAFNLWLGREKRAGRDYTAEQRAWLEAMRDEIAANAHLALADIGEVFADRGGVYAARRAFGDRLAPMLDDLNKALVA
mgnify:CR=1 FL=1